jgi:hypothetical protein
MVWQNGTRWFQWAWRIVFVATLAILLGLLIGWAYHSRNSMSSEEIRSIPFWGWIAALLPAAMVAQQGVYLILVKSEAVWAHLSGGESEEILSPVRSASTVPATSDLPTGNKGFQVYQRQLAHAGRNALRQSKSYFNHRQLTVQYALLTMLLGVVTLALFYVCCEPPSCILGNHAHPIIGDHDDEDSSTEIKTASQPRDVESSRFIPALRLGAAGAYIYVLIYLGRRNFQRDITAAAALWSAVQLVLGPVLAYTLVYFLSAPPGSNKDSSVDFAAVYFLAGMSPRLIADWVSDKVQKVWLSPGTGSSSRSVSLNQVRGITSTIEGRLNEEGIEDVAGLSMANPVRLLRNTPYDPRQILSWIDEAILITTLPKHWSALEDLGVTGAMDLAWYALDDNEDDDTSTAAPGPNEKAKDPAIEALAAAVPGLDYSILYNVCWRLLNDDQVAMVWTMYQSDGQDPKDDREQG